MLITAGCANAIPYFVGQIVDTPNTRNPQVEYLFGYTS